MRRQATLGILVLAASGSLLAVARAADLPAKTAAPFELVVRYDFSHVESDRVADVSGKKRDGRLERGEITYGREKMAVALVGDGRIVVAGTNGELDPKGRALAIGAWCNPAMPDGVIASIEAETGGIRLSLKEGVPCFTIRAGGRTAEVAGDEPVVLGQWVHLAGTVDERGRLALYVGGWPGADVAGFLPPSTAGAALVIGATPGANDGGFRGMLEDVRLYWGVPDREEMQDWLARPGCGCRH